MTITVESFNGHDLADANLQAYLDMADTPFSRRGENILVNPIGRFSRYARTQQQPRTIVLKVQVKGSPLNTYHRILEGWFEPGTQGTLVITEDGTSKALDCVVERFLRYDGSAATFLAVLVAPDPRLRSETQSTDTEAVTTTGQTWTVNNPGNTVESAPVITVTPTSLKAASASWRYKREVIVANRVDRVLSNWALEVTGGGWDHAAEVTAGRSLSSGDDVRVLVDGRETPRWSGGGSTSDWNDTATKIWSNITFSPGLTASLQDAITDVSPADGGDLDVEPGDTSGWPDAGAILLGSEVILYTGKTDRAFTGVTRGARNTTAAAASAGATLRWVEHRVQVMYGYTGASAPDARDDLKPMIDLDASDNEMHTWAAFSDDDEPGRSMQWARSLLSTHDAQAGRILAAGGSPATSMAFEYQDGGAQAGKPNYNRWSRPFPTGTLSAPSGITDGNVWGEALGATAEAITVTTGAITEGQLMLAAVHNPSGAAVSAPAGWTEIGHSSGFYLFWKVAGASEGTTFEFTWSGAQYASAAIVTYNAPNSVDVYEFNTTAGGTTHSAPSVTPTVPNGMLVCIYSTERVENVTEVVWTAASGQTGIHTENSGAGAGAGSESGLFLSDELLGAEAEATGVRTASTDVSLSGGNGIYASVVLTAGVGEAAVDVDDELAIVVRGIDADGNDTLVSTIRGPKTTTQAIGAPVGGMYDLAFIGRSQVVIQPPEGVVAGETDPTTAYGAAVQQFTAPSTGILASVRLKLRATSGTPTATLAVYSDNGSDGPLERVSEEATATVSGATDAWYEFTFNLEIREGVQYHLNLKASDNSVRWNRTTAPYAGGISTVAGYTFTFQAIATEIEFEDGAEATDGVTATVDDVTVRLDPDGVPYVAFGAQEDAYWLNGVLENSTTAQTITFALLVDVDDEVEVDVAAGRARNLTQGEPVLYGVTFSDPFRFDLDPGDNTLEWTEAGVAGVSVATAWYGRWN